MDFDSPIQEEVTSLKGPAETDDLFASLTYPDKKEMWTLFFTPSQVDSLGNEKPNQWECQLCCELNTGKGKIDPKTNKPTVVRTIYSQNPSKGKV